MGRLKTRTQFYAFALIFAFGLIVLFLRNPDPIVHPTLFAEDATWVTYLLADRLDAYVNPRYDYLVLGQTMMLDLALQASLIVTGGTLALLPQAIALISYAFWASLAGIGYRAFAQWMSIPWRLAIAAGILLLPIGEFMNEIVGRILNLGYLFLPLAFMLCLLREERRGQIYEILLVSGLVVCIFTNPISVAVVGAHLVLRMLRRILRREEISRWGDTVLALAVLGFVALFIARLGQGANPPGNVLVVDSLFEMIGARSLLYPFLFAFYERLSDPIVVAGLFITILLIAIALILSPPHHKLLGLCLVAAALGSIAITVATRPFLTGILDGYGTTFPGRYYMAQNIFSFLTVIWALSRVPKAVQLVAGFMIVALVVPGVGRLFEFGRPQMVIATDGDFFDQVAGALQRDPTAEGKTLLLVDAYPDGWSVAMPASLAQATADAAGMTAPSNKIPSNLIDLEALPWQWGLRTPDSDPGTRIPLIEPLQTALLNDLSRNGDLFRATGRDPYIVLDLTRLDQPEDASLFSFDFTCENRTRFVEMQIFWATRDQPDISEERSLFFSAGPGHNIVPLDSHPGWPGSQQISAMRVDVIAPRSCSGYGFGDLAFGTRRPVS